MTPAAWQPYRSWGPKARSYIARVCYQCQATTHRPAPDGWRWRVTTGNRGKQGKYTQAWCGCSRPKVVDIPPTTRRRVGA